MLHPRPGVDYPESWRELLGWFPDDAACLAYLERLRWPEGFVCPACRGGTGWRMGGGLVRRATFAGLKAFKPPFMIAVSGFDNQERMSLLRCPQFLLWQALRKAFPQDSH